MHSPLRRLAVALAVTVALAIGASSALAAMPASNPNGYAGLSKTAYAKVFNVTIKGTDLEGDAMEKSVNNGLMGGMGATISVKKAVVKGYVTYQTITITPTKVGEVTSTITNAFATLSGGDYGSGVISSTKLANGGTKYTVTMWFDEQGENPNLNLRFYLYHS